MLLRLSLAFALTACTAEFDEELIPAAPDAPIGFGGDAAGGQEPCYASDGDTFRACAEAGGQEIRFTAVDEIDLGGNVEVASNTTIRGETRRGITLRGGILILTDAEDVIIRNLHVVHDSATAISLCRARRVLLDHLIVSDAFRALVVSGSEDITFSRSLVTDVRLGMRIIGTNEEGRCGPNARVTVTRNVFEAFEETPRISGTNEDVVFANNVVLGWQTGVDGAVILRGPMWSATRVSLVENHFQRMGRADVAPGDAETLFSIEDGLDLSGVYEFTSRSLPRDGDIALLRAEGTGPSFPGFTDQQVGETVEKSGPQQPSPSEVDLVEAAELRLLL